MAAVKTMIKVVATITDEATKSTMIKVMVMVTMIFLVSHKDINDGKKINSDSEFNTCLNDHEGS